ncbi:MAG: deoxyribonuclease IV, partial [Actinomycetota bacterium]
PYLVNIASANPSFLHKARDLATRTIETCDALGVDALVLHAGNGGQDEPGEALRRAAATIDAVAATAERTRVLVELMAGTRGAVASTIAEATALLDRVADPSVGVCLDTCHLFAAGYGLEMAEGVEDLFHELLTHGLTDRVGLVHANDSAFGRGERRDRHERIGHGHIGTEGFRALLARPEASGWAFMLETPGEASDHAEQIATLRSLTPQGSSSARGPSW